MRTNLPVTNREQEFSAHERLISTPDLKGVIQSANDTFVKVSGFSLEELKGKAHNLVRHPDIPEAVYKNFWDTLKARKPWMGIIKNRCKNGDHYWVSAYVSPVFRNGEHTGYQSVRTNATPEQKERAEALYASMRMGKSVTPFWRLKTLRVKIGLAACVAALFGIAGGFLLGQGSSLGGAALAVLAPIIAIAGTTATTQRIARLAAKARHIFDNEVGCVTYCNGHDEVAQTELAMSMLEARINALRGRVEDLTDDLGDSAAESSRAADAGHEAIIMQMQEIEQVVTAIEQMTATVQDVSRNTAEASTTTMEVVHQAESGREKILRTTEAMRSLATRVGEATTAIEELREETHSIRNVLDVINAIAAQTNLLALNAAIEAARAGESGRGFAVVATEVRELAGRVSQSTDDISQMTERLESRANGAVSTMQESQKSANLVAEDAQESSRVILEIERGMEQIRDMTVQIATATEEQSSVAEEINRRVNSVNDVFQTTTNMASTTKSTSEGLVKMVEELHGVVLQFRDS